MIESSRASLIFRSSTPVSVLTVLPVLRSCTDQGGGQLGALVAFSLRNVPVDTAGRLFTTYLLLTSTLNHLNLYLNLFKNID